MDGHQLTPCMAPTKGTRASLGLPICNSPSAMNSTIEGSMVLLTLSLSGGWDAYELSTKRGGVPPHESTITNRGLKVSSRTHQEGFDPK
jgi:hypothetical protein